MEHNGWTNRETWAVALWINNDEGLQSSAHELVRGFDAVSDVSGAVDALQEWFTTLCNPNLYKEEYGGEYPSGLATMASDCGSLWRVNWDEITLSLLEDIKV